MPDNFDLQNQINNMQWLLIEQQNQRAQRQRDLERQIEQTQRDQRQANENAAAAYFASERAAAEGRNYRGAQFEYQELSEKYQTQFGHYSQARELITNLLFGESQSGGGFILGGVTATPDQMIDTLATEQALSTSDEAWIFSALVAEAAHQRGNVSLFEKARTKALTQGGWHPMLFYLYRDRFQGAQSTAADQIEQIAERAITKKEGKPAMASKLVQTMLYDAQCGLFGDEAAKVATRIRQNAAMWSWEQFEHHTPDWMDRPQQPWDHKSMNGRVADGAGNRDIKAGLVRVGTHLSRLHRLDELLTPLLNQPMPELKSGAAEGALRKMLSIPFGTPDHEMFWDRQRMAFILKAGGNVNAGEQQMRTEYSHAYPVDVASIGDLQRVFVWDGDNWKEREHKLNASQTLFLAWAPVIERIRSRLAQANEAIAKDSAQNTLHIAYENITLKETWLSKDVLRTPEDKIVKDHRKLWLQSNPESLAKIKKTPYALIYYPLVFFGLISLLGFAASPIHESAEKEFNRLWQLNKQMKKEHASEKEMEELVGVPAKAYWRKRKVIDAISAIPAVGNFFEGGLLPNSRERGMSLFFAIAGVFAWVGNKARKRNAMDALIVSGDNRIKADLKLVKEIAYYEPARQICLGAKGT